MPSGFKSVSVAAIMDSLCASTTLAGPALFRRRFFSRFALPFPQSRVAKITVPLKGRDRRAQLSFRFKAGCPLVARGKAMWNVGGDVFKDA
jgi:hypothetical protein